MVSLNDIRPLLNTARLFGCGFYMIKEDDIVIMKYGIVYSILSMLLYGSVCAMNFYRLAEIYIHNTMNMQLLRLTVIRTGLSYVCVFTDILVTLRSNWKIRAALSHLRIFDRATKYKEYRNSNTVRYVSYALSVAILSYWSTVGYVTFRCEPEDSMFNAITYAVINATISMQLMTFASLSFLLRERFNRLCEILLLPDDGKIMVMDRSSRRQFRLQEIWWLHSCLANATEMINSTYSMQLLLWIAHMAFNTLTRIYTINDHLIIPVLLKVREIMLVSACVTNLLIIATVCHATATEANRVGKIAFTPSSTIIAKRNFMQDNMEAATYFQLRQVHFFAASGIIRIDLPLLLSIASGITTYLVILHTANDT